VSPEIVSRFDRIKNLRDAGASLRDIGKAEGVSYQRIWQILSDGRDKKASHVAEVLARDLSWRAEYEAGTTPREIAARDGTSTRYVLKRITMTGVVRRRRGRPSKPLETPAAEV